MFCPACGKPNNDAASVCAACGVRLPGSPNKDAEAVLKHLLPVKTSAWAIAAGYLGLLSPLMIFAPPAIFCGVAALIHLNKRPELRGVFRAWVGIVMGLLGTAMLLMLITQ